MLAAAAGMSPLFLCPSGRAVFFYPPRLDGYERKTQDTRANGRSWRATGEAVIRLHREPEKQNKDSKKKKKHEKTYFL